ncbi:Rne/Rng family ribonuclease [Paracoccus sp. MBLB3053]|uniref:Ribonuclease E n=1 Tax=Paracoccus aurantius TaxID=3073814 RepID=A0ABU2HMF6_9RHOB|nr:Rne/Rng family ribonuclease [Paracoccus sp. MBLB3053]MDS9466213.1 Rne/Rng family ribonuclease [Paracoccus sp. MBLB3053]
MSKKMLIDATHAEETRVVVVDGTKVEEFDFETVNKRQLAGNIYLAKVTRVEPSLQAAFVDYGGNRHGFLAFAEIHPDYYQIPAADRKALIEEERQAAAAESDEAEKPKRSSSRSRQSAKPAAADAGDVVVSEEIAGMAVLDPSEGEGNVAQLADGSAPAVADDENTEDQIEEDAIESVADEDVAEEIAPPKKPRARRYKIQEVIKVRQIMLVQVVKEERGNKGAALTTYLSLAGRYCVLMPNTARGGGISRKITNAADRKKLKEIAAELEVPEGAGLIIRTAGSQRTRTEIRRDYEYLMRLWEQIRELTFKSIAPAPIYEEGDLIKRTIRDLYSKEIDEVLVEGERGYRTAKDFMKMIMPSHSKNVKHYSDSMPLYARYQVESYLGGMFNPVVQLKSGGYIVIGVTEALVAIDVNSGRATKEGSIEDTALKTNLEAAEEIARQLRLRDLAGLIVIDFIDMEERKNNASVEKRFKDKLKTDRARIQVGRISGFGLLEMSRQRLRPGMLESTTQPCAHCHGTGLIRSDDSLALTILRAIEEEGTRKRSREVLVKAPVAVANFLMNAKREHIAGIEARYGMAVRVEADPSLISPDYAIEKFKTATRNVPEIASPVVSVDARLMAQIDDEDLSEDEVELEEDEAVEDAQSAEASRSEGAENGDGSSKSRRRRRRRRRNGKNGDDQGRSDENGTDEADGQEQPIEEDAPSEPVAEVEAVEALSAPNEPVTEPVTEVVASETPETADKGVTEAAEAEEAKPRRRRSRRRKTDEVAEEAVQVESEVVEPVASEPAEVPAETAEPVEPEPAVAAADTPAEAESTEPVAEQLAEPQPEEADAEDVVQESVVSSEVVELATETGVSPAAVPAPEAEPAMAADEEASRPKRRGWWSMG